MTLNSCTEIQWTVTKATHRSRNVELNRCEAPSHKSLVKTQIHIGNKYGRAKFLGPKMPPRSATVLVFSNLLLPPRDFQSETVSNP